MALTLALGVLLATANVVIAQQTCPEIPAPVTPPIVNATSYSYKVTISVEGKNETVEAYETYDMVNGSIRLMVNFPDKDNSSVWMSESIHHDYKYNQTFVIDVDSKSCDVSDLNKTYSIFGLGIEDGFKNPDYSYYWNGDYNYSLDNATVVNGVKAEKYSTCILYNESSLKYEVDLYFSADNWNTRAGNNVPLMLVLKVNQTVGKSFLEETYTYIFTSYHDGKSDWFSSGSDPFWDIICPGRKDSLPAPEIPNKYTATEELFNLGSKTIHTSKRFYDYPEKLYRSDFVAPSNFSWGMQNHRFTKIHDFNAGVEYLIDKEIGNCTVKALTLHPWDYDTEADPSHQGYIHMRNLADFYAQRNLTYTGRHMHQGRSVDTWTSAVPYKWNSSHASGELNETLMFTTPDWSSSDVSPVPLGTRFTSRMTTPNGTTESTMMIQFSGVAKKMHGIHWFEIGSCFNKDNSKNFVLMFDGFFGKYLYRYGGLMDVAIQAGVAKAANISKIRVSSWSSKQLAIDAASGNAKLEQKLFVSFWIYDHPNVHGNISEYKPTINLTEAITNLKSAVEGNRLIVEFKIDSESVPNIMTAFPNYFKEQSELYSPPPPAQPTNQPPSPSGGGGASLSKGAIAGLSIGMVVLGVIIGAGVIHIRNKRGNQQFGYSIQD